MLSGLAVVAYRNCIIGHTGKGQISLRLYSGRFVESVGGVTMLQGLKFLEADGTEVEASAEKT